MANLYSLCVDRTSGQHEQVGTADTQFVGGTLKTSSGNMTLQPASSLIIASAMAFAAAIGLTVTAGSSAFDFSGGTGLFKTSSGANTLSGDTTLASGKNFTAAGGGSAFDLSAASGLFKTPTGAVTIGNGAVGITGQTTFSGGILASGANANDWSGGSGTFKSSTGAVTMGPGAVTLSGLTTLAPAASTSGSPNLFSVTPPAHTTLTASTEARDFNFNMARTVQWATGDFTSQRAVRFTAPTYAAAGASTITNGATVSISGAPVPGTNMTITNPYAFWVEAGNSRFEANVTVHGNLTVDGTATLSGGVTVTKIVDTGLTLWGSPAAGEVGYMTSTDATLAKAKADSDATAHIYGVYDGTSGQVVTEGVVGMLFVSGLNSGTAPASGQKVFLSAATAGKVTNAVPGAGNVEAVLGILKSAAGYDNTNGSVHLVKMGVEEPDAINA